MNTQFTDTHAHLYLDAFRDDIDDVIQRAAERGVDRIFLPNIDSTSADGLLSLCEKYKGTCFPMMGLHPTSVNKNYRDELDNVRTLIKSFPFIAVGEIGIDLYWNKNFFSEQQIAFREQLQLAIEENLPVVIHSRESFEEIFNIMDQLNVNELSGVFHSFTGTIRQAEKILSYGFYIGINGIVTFKNSGLAEVVKTIPIDKLLIETDAPFLAPVPYRGKRNESSYLTDIAEKIAAELNIEVEKLASITTQNALNLFNKVF